MEYFISLFETFFPNLNHLEFFVIYISDWLLAWQSVIFLLIIYLFCLIKKEETSHWLKLLWILAVFYLENNWVKIAIQGLSVYTYTEKNTCQKLPNYLETHDKFWSYVLSSNQFILPSRWEFLSVIQHIL